MIRIDLSGKTAIVTGAGQGLGQATALRLHEAGANVVVNYFEDAQGANRARAEATAASMDPNRVAVMAADVRDPAAVDEMMDRTLGRFGSLDILVNNAAVIRDRTVKKMSHEEWHDVIGTDLTGVFHTCQAVSERLSDGGRIVNLASIAATIGFFGQGNYAAAKAGVVALTKVLSRELAKRRITVNAVAPGVVLTEMGMTIPETVRDEMLKSIPLARFGEPVEVADVIAFLSSDLASYVTGQTIHVNGGWWG